MKNKIYIINRKKKYILEDTSITILIAVIIALLLVILFILMDEQIHYTENPSVDSIESDSINIDEIEEYTNFMNIQDIVGGGVSDFIEYAKKMQPLQGQTLAEAGISLDPNGPKTRANMNTQYFYQEDKGAFLPYNPEDTMINDSFIHRAMILSDKTQTERIPAEFLNNRGVRNLRALPF